jgi:ribonuclease VapC
MVIDSSAIVAVLLGEPEAPALERALTVSEVRLLGAPTLLELSIVIEARLGPAGTALMDELLKEAEIRTVAFDAVMADAATAAWRVYGRGNHPARLNFGDCLTYGLAAMLDEPILCIGADFARTDATVVPIS